MKPTITWVLLADQTFARILENRGKGEGLQQLRNRQYDAPETLPYSDDEGRALAGNSESRVRLERHIEHSHEAEQFARKLVSLLEADKRAGRFDRLIICAAPTMLGLLRSQMTQELNTVVKAEISKELARMPTDDLMSHFDSALKL